MVQIQNKAPFSSLIDEGQVGVVTMKFEEYILKSFAEDAARTGVVRPQTAAEIKRRFDIVADWFKTLRGDMGWSVQRCLDELPTALRMTLDGEVYTPNVRRSTWVPSNEGEA